MASSVGHCISSAQTKSTMAPIALPDSGPSLLRELWDTTRMRLLVEVERTGSLSAAAQAIGIGQPSASQHLRLLEAAAGQRPLQGAGGGRPAGSAAARGAGDGIVLEPFLEDEVVGVARPGLLSLRGGRLAPAKIADHMLLTREPGSGTQQLVDAELTAIGVEPAGVWKLGSSEAPKRGARGGRGPAFLPRGPRDPAPSAGRPPMRRTLSVARLAGRPLSPSERAFVATLTRCCVKTA